MVHEILIWPDPRLREKAAEVSAFDGELRALVSDMFETMYAAKGVGLAANQIGISQRVAVIDTSTRDAAAKPMVFVNPTLLKTEGSIPWEEGCLSVPGEAEEVKRFERVTVRAQDLEGKEFTLEAEGMLAIALQHEVDHLEGTLFVDRISSLKRELIKRRMKRLKAEREQEKREGKQPEVP